MYLFGSRKQVRMIAALAQVHHYIHQRCLIAIPLRIQRIVVLSQDVLVELSKIKTTRLTSISRQTLVITW